MRLKIREWGLGAGRPVAFVHEADAKKLNIHVGDRLEVSYNGGKLVAIVDIVHGFLKKGEISLSEEIME
ncbi:MAG: hypothetical protein MUF61_03575, partial [archaeon]|nr:hypothetical protein [archaeon]